jgi:biopolymer transport protein ExbD
MKTIYIKKIDGMKTMKVGQDLTDLIDIMIIMLMIMIMAKYSN